MNLLKPIERYDSDENAISRLRSSVGRLARCIRWQSNKISHADKRSQSECGACRYHFSDTAGTILHDSHLPLRKWFIAIYLICESQNGVYALQLKRTLGVTYKIAWYLCHRIREAVKDADHSELVRGVVECDKAFIRGNRKNMHASRQAKLKRVIRNGLAEDTDLIVTNENNQYEGIAENNTRHETVSHTQKEWVRGVVHTNGLDGVWSLFKRSSVGSYHQIAVKHLDRDLDEFEFRFNNRNNSYLFRDMLLRLLNSANLEYKDLTAEDDEAAEATLSAA